MTATPIPRTLALTIYGDLDVSVIDELPAGRKPVITKQIFEEAAGKAYEFVRREIAGGAQAFIVCPVIEDAPDGLSKASAGPGPSDLKSAIKMHEHLSRHVFPDCRVGLLHGRLSTEEKETTMAAFHAGEIPILVGTTVVEVGVDVPNASVMVVQQAERFGLAQLHQLRGRVGRGHRQSHCLLIASRHQTDTARQRLAVLEKTQDGFEIAETDMRLRGPGEFMGTRQSGLPALRVANLLRDQEILEKARQAAIDFVEHGDRKEVARLVSYIKDNWNRRYGLVRVG
jgi:ATP-dependent DNA helicase RecG